MKLVVHEFGLFKVLLNHKGLIGVNVTLVSSGDHGLKLHFC